HRANTGARPRTKRHVFVLRWIDLAPSIGTKHFRCRISFRQMMSEKMTANDAATVTKRERSHRDGIVISSADGKRHRRQNAHAFLNDAVEKGKLRYLIARGRITAEDAIKFIHQFEHDRGVLCEKKHCPRQRAGSSFEAGSEQDCRLTDQLGVRYTAVFIITRPNQERKHIGAISRMAPAFLHQCKNLALHLLGMSEQRMIWRAGHIDRKEPGWSGDIATRL